MSKKSNTMWFILGATAFNILLTIICILILLFIFTQFIWPYLPEEALESIQGWSLLVIFIGGIALSFVLYRIILKQLMKKIDFEKHFDPIFGRRRK